MKKRVKKQKKMKKGAVVLILLGLIIFLSGILIHYVFLNKEEVVEEEEQEEVVEEEIELKYAMPTDATKYQEELNDEINALVETEGYSNEDLAKLVAKNFIVEYYTLSNVTTHTPGGLQYVPSELQERFEDFAGKIYDFYNYYEDRDKLYVNNILITASKAITYTYDDDLDEIKTRKNLKGYSVTMDWTYANGDENTTVVKVVMWDSDYGIVSVQN